MREIHYEYNISIQPTAISVYKVYPSANRKGLSGYEGRLLQSKKSTNNEMTYTTKKHIINSVNYIIGQAKLKRYWSNEAKKWFSFRVNFITLTLPSVQIHCDVVIKNKCLNQFISEMKRKKPNVKFVWRAEKQQNGNIHFHLLTDQYYHYLWIRNTWNRCINKLQYVDRFQSMHAHNNPNSTDVHAIKGIKNVAGYIAKYISKDSTNQNICGKVWSRDYSTAKYAKLVLTEGEFDHNTIDCLIRSKRYEKRYSDWCMTITGKIHSLLMSYDSLTADTYKQHITKYQNSQTK